MYLEPTISSNTDDKVVTLVKDVLNMFNQLPFGDQIQFYKSIKQGFIEDRMRAIKDSISDRDQISSKIEFLEQGLKELSV